MNHNRFDEQFHDMMAKFDDPRDFADPEPDANAFSIAEVIDFREARRG